MVHYLDCLVGACNCITVARTQVGCVFVPQKAVTRPGKDEGSLVMCAEVWFVTRVDKAGILLDLKICQAISGVIS